MIVGEGMYLPCAAGRRAGCSVLPPTFRASRSSRPRPWPSSPAHQCGPPRSGLQGHPDPPVPRSGTSPPLGRHKRAAIESPRLWVTAVLGVVGVAAAAIAVRRPPHEMVPRRSGLESAGCPPSEDAARHPGAGGAAGQPREIQRQKSDARRGQLQMTGEAPPATSMYLGDLFSPSMHAGQGHDPRQRGSLAGRLRAGCRR